MTDENEKCYCRNANSCLKRGVFDLSKCMGVPIFATLPHFLRTDPSYINLVDGLAPSELLHAIRVYFEPVSKLTTVNIYTIYGVRHKREMRK